MRCTFEIYDQEKGGVVKCGKEATHRFKKSSYLCKEHYEYAKIFISKYDLEEIKEDK